MCVSWRVNAVVLPLGILTEHSWQSASLWSFIMKSAQIVVISCHLFICATSYTRITWQYELVSDVAFMSRLWYDMNKYSRDWDRNGSRMNVAFVPKNRRVKTEKEGVFSLWACFDGPKSQDKSLSQNYKRHLSSCSLNTLTHSKGKRPDCFTLHTQSN